MEHPLPFGVFITVEGIEGSGKSTIIDFMSEILSKGDIEHVKTREPGGTNLSERIRSIFLDGYDEGIVPDAELLLMFASRAQHLSQVIMPALRVGKWVVSDRFTDSTYAYQGGGRGVAIDRIQQIEEWVQGDVSPDHTLLLDIPVEMIMDRIKKRKTKDRIENENPKFFNLVRKNYLERAIKNGYKIIDASNPLDVVKENVRSWVQSLLSRRA